jgi:hypothetical protein
MTLALRRNPPRARFLIGKASARDNRKNRDVIMQRATRPARNVADMPLALNFHIVNCPVGQTVVWGVIGSVEPATLQQSPQTLHMRNPKNRRWIRRTHHSFTFALRIALSISAWHNECPSGRDISPILSPIGRSFLLWIACGRIWGMDRRPSMLLPCAGLTWGNAKGVP